MIFYFYFTIASLLNHLWSALSFFFYHPDSCEGMLRQCIRQAATTTHFTFLCRENTKSSFVYNKNIPCNFVLVKSPDGIDLFRTGGVSGVFQVAGSSTHLWKTQRKRHWSAFSTQLIKLTHTHICTLIHCRLKSHDIAMMKLHREEMNHHLCLFGLGKSCSWICIHFGARVQHLHVIHHQHP